VGVEFDPRATFWYVWPILVGCYSDKALFQFVVDAMLRWRSDKMTHDFPVILPFLALLRTSHPFANVRKLADSFAMKVVDWVRKNAESYLSTSCCSPSPAWIAN
jgi:hypothetical protein